MFYSTHLAFALTALVLAPVTEATEPEDKTPQLDDALKPILERIGELVAAFHREPVSPEASAQFERELQKAIREQGRTIAEWAYNHVEPNDTTALPKRVTFEGNSFCRLAKKTPLDISTLFGTIRLRRLGYRAPSSVGERVLFPLCRELGVVHSATPAFMERLAHFLAESGATQQQTLTRLRVEHGSTNHQDQHECHRRGAEAFDFLQGHEKLFFGGVQRGWGEEHGDRGLSRENLSPADQGFGFIRPCGGAKAPHAKDGPWW